MEKGDIKRLLWTTGTIAALKKTRQLIGFILFLISAYFIGHMAYSNWDDILLSTREVSISKLIFAIAVSLLMLTFKGIYNERIISSLNGERKFNFLILHSYSISQILRYIPGKVWGVLYQGLYFNGTISTQSITAGNILQYIYTNIFSLLVTLSIASTYLDLEIISITILLFSILVIKHFQKKATINKYIIDKINKTATKKHSSPVKTSYGTTLLILDWIFYIAIWAIVLPEGIKSMDFLYLSALYASASLLSLIAVFSPGGLAVREALFLFLGAQLGYNDNNLLLYGLLLRLILTTSEIFFMVTLTIFQKATYAYKTTPKILE